MKVTKAETVVVRLSTDQGLVRLGVPALALLGGNCRDEMRVAPHLRATLAS